MDTIYSIVIGNNIEEQHARDAIFSIHILSISFK